MTPENSPFDPAHASRFFVETACAMEALERLNRGLGAREPFLLVTGSSGTGKTALAHEAIARWGTRVAAVFLAYPALDGTELLEEILRRLGAEPPENASRSRLVSLLERTIGEITSPGQVAVIVVDDADRLSAEALEELRMLVNATQQAQRSIEVVLIGLPVLEARLDDPAFATLRQRVSARVRLSPLSATDTELYVQHRVTVTGGDAAALFPRPACREIAALSKGVPRQINVLAAESLSRATEAGSATVTPAHVQAAASALWNVTPRASEDFAPMHGVRPRPAPPQTEPPKPAPPLRTDPQKPAPPTKAETPTPPPAPKATESAPMPRAAAPAPAPAPRPAPEPAPAPKAATPELPPTPKPVAPKPIVAKPAPPPPPEPEEAYGPTVTHHDPNEWVKRFVGEKGPLQIGSRSQEIPTWDLDYLDGPTAPPADAATAAPRKKKPVPKRPASRRSMPRIPGRLTALAAAAVVIVAVVAVLIRASGPASERAVQAKVAKATADSVKAALASTGSRKSKASASEASPPAAVKPRSKRPFTIEVGSYDDYSTAYEERDRMQILTGIEGFVVRPESEGPQKYRVVLGIFKAEERATSAANMLVNSRTLRRATVVPLPPRDTRD